MSRTEQSCVCNHPELVRLPVHGLALEVDTSGLVPAPGPALACRERVDQDMHIYIDGNLSESGDGLSPETAVKSYADAVLALSRYDGCNLHAAHLHFLPLEDPDASYSDFTVYTVTYNSFTTLSISGESHETTRLGSCTFYIGTRIAISNICLESLTCLGSYTYISGNMSFKPRNARYIIDLNHGGYLAVLEDANVYFNNCSCLSCIKITRSMAGLAAGSKFYTVGDISVSVAFMYAQYNSTFTMGKTVDFSGCASVTGKRYRLGGLSYLYSNGISLPGNQAPQVETGSVYV